jgi:hypothetical protein
MVDRPTGKRVSLSIRRAAISRKEIDCRIKEGVSNNARTIRAAALAQLTFRKFGRDNNFGLWEVGAPYGRMA